LAYVAAKTKRLKLAMAGNLLPLHGHPLRVAEELAMLDNLTRGRIIAGFVRGIPREYLALSIPLREGRPRFEEALDVILKAWTNDLLNHDGQFYHYKDVDMWPRPYQSPHPPVWVGAIGPEPTRNVAKRPAVTLCSTAPVIPRRLRRVRPAVHGQRYPDRAPRVCRGKPEGSGEALQDPF
jgi:alkanesulfonate monooxygenase SsuD/methylene tetrahydromethanopterin reductase-like flavin-dependent oxidoreductase (luciferase family)